MIDYPNELNIIFEKLNRFNVKPIIVGGYIRDFFLNIQSKDIDIELYGISTLEEIERILAEFGSINSVGKSFGVCKLLVKDLDIDFSLPRTDNKISSGHKGFNITTNTNLDFKTAASRRDFTINSIGYDVKNKILLDPFNGIEDIKNKTLRAVDIFKFREDPLRVLRAIQFSTRFNFRLEQNLFLECKNMINDSLLNELAHERVFDEIKKLLLKSKKPSRGILLLKKMDGVIFFKEFSSLTAVKFKHILRSIDSLNAFMIADEKLKLKLMLAVLCYYFSPSDRINFMKKLTYEKNIIKEIELLLSNIHSINLSNYNDFDIYNLATKVNIQNLTTLLKAIYLNKKNKELNLLNLKAHKLGVLNTKIEAILHGRDLVKLGLQPSKIFSEILESAYEAQIKSEFTTYEEACIWLKNKISQLS